MRAPKKQVRKLARWVIDHALWDAAHYVFGWRQVAVAGLASVVLGIWKWLASHATPEAVVLALWAFAGLLLVIAAIARTLSFPRKTKAQPAQMPGPTLFSGEPISINLKDADIKDVLRTFSRLTGLNIVTDSDVSGAVTVNLDNVPWDQALDVILTSHSLGYVVQSNVMRVARRERLVQERSQDQQRGR
jgi:hypothetical protein